MNKLYEVLEICLQDIEQGADIDTVLFRYPEFAEELRPILEASAGAKNMAVPVPSVEVVRRNRARVLQRAAQLREAKAKPASRRIWSNSLRRVAVTLVVVTVLFVSGTNLVRAASTTLPGDNLYPVKRTWEDVLLLFTFDVQQREALEVEHENERHLELRELFARGRFAEVEFAGQVTAQNGGIWIVAGVPVIVSEQTEIRDPGIVIGSAVRVKGEAQDDGVVLAERVRLLSSDEKLPDLEDDHNEDKDSGDRDGQEHDNSGKGSGMEQPEDDSKTPDSDSENSGSGNNNDSDSKDDNSGSGQDGSEDGDDDHNEEEDKSDEEGGDDHQDQEDGGSEGEDHDSSDEDDD